MGMELEESRQESRLKSHVHISFLGGGWAGRDYFDRCLIPTPKVSFIPVILFRLSFFPHAISALSLAILKFAKRNNHLIISLLPVFKDTNTATPFKEHFPADDGCAARNALPDHIYMDCMGFGMGCCCLQVGWSHSQFPDQCPRPVSFPDQCPRPVSFPDQYTKPVSFPDQCARPVSFPDQCPRPVSFPNQCPRPVSFPDQCPRPVSFPDQCTRPVSFPDCYLSNVLQENLYLNGPTCVCTCM